jgi:hypothetical protein
VKDLLTRRATTVFDPGPEAVSYRERLPYVAQNDDRLSGSPGFPHRSRRRNGSTDR